MTRGSTPATALATKRPSGSIPSSMGLLLARDHERGGAVVDAAGVTGGDRSALAERRFQACKLLGARIRTWMLVALEAIHRDELIVEATGVGSGRPTLLRA